VVVAIDPGASTTRSLVVVNRSADLVLTVRLTAVDATAAADGAVQYATSAPAGSPATWLTLSDVIATLEPNAKLPVTLTVAPPSNAVPGTVTAAVVARVDSAVQAVDQRAVPAPAAVTLPVAITVNGAPTALVSITDARVVDVNGRQSLTITFQNSGATAITMAGRVQVRGTRPYTETVRVSVAALARTAVQVPFAMPHGVTTVPISVVAADAAGDEATWSGSVGLTDPPTVSAVPSNRPPSAQHRQRATGPARGAARPPLTLILVVFALAAAAVWFGAELRRNRAARRATKRQMPTPTTSLQSGAAHAAAPRPTVASPAGTADPMGAVAVQLGALVDAIDRLVARLTDGWVPPPEPKTSTASPAAPTDARSMAEASAALYRPAASRVPHPSADDLYDWPTEAQLEQFAARRRAAHDDVA
jgi:hypothetical protein